jgi:8-oxo-dGTP pyrophosphatase MutT (NUDIX family)
MDSPRSPLPAIRAKAVCLFRRKSEVLVIPGHDPVTDIGFYIPPGGGVEFGEHSSEAARREVGEELGAEIEELELLGVFENHFVYKGLEEHEIVFVYSARFPDPSWYEKETIEGVESNGAKYVAKWIGLDLFETPGKILFPDGLFRLLRGDAQMPLTSLIGSGYCSRVSGWLGSSSGLGSRISSASAHCTRSRRPFGDSS